MSSAAPKKGHAEYADGVLTAPRSEGLKRTKTRIASRLSELDFARDTGIASHMNVVEKETLENEALEPSVIESGTGLKVASKNGHSTNGTKINRLPAFRENRQISQVEIRRFMGDRSRDLQQFVAPLEDEIRKAHKYRSRERRVSVSAQGKVADLVLKVIRDIAHRETGIFTIEPHVPQLLSALYAGSVEVGIVSGLVRRAQKALAARDAYEREGGSRAGNSAQPGRSVQYDIGRELDELTMLLKWYVRRRMSLAGLEIELSNNPALIDSEGHLTRDDQDAVYGFEIMHDHQMFGTKGCLLASGLRLIGRDGQPLWLRVTVLWNGAPVTVRPEWSSWTDPGTGESVEVLAERSPFCSLVPIRPNAQRLVIDEIRAFVPYAALELPVGRCDVEFVVSVIDGDGHEILSISKPESICVPRRDHAGAAVPAPHAAGMWPHDVVSGDKISELVATSGFAVVAGWERHSVSVQFDLSLFMHAGESVMLECRFVDGQGNIVELSSLGIPFVASELNVAVESVSSYRYRRVLHPKGAWAFYRGLSIDIPVEFLLLTPGAHHLTCEIVIVSEDDRVLCGDMACVSVHVPERSGRARNTTLDEALEGGITAPVARRRNSSVELESIDVDSAWQFGADEGIRVQATFCPRNSGRQIADLAAGRVGEIFSPYRVELSLEREDGHVLLQAYSDALGMSFKPVTRAVCMEGQSGFAEHSVVANFSKEEVLGWSVGLEGARVGSKVRLFARVTALTPEGDVLVSEQKEFFVKPLSSGGKQVIDVKGPAPVIVDTVGYAYLQAGKLSARVLVNVPFGEFLEEGVTVHCTLVEPNGKRELLGKKLIRSQQGAVWTRQQMGLSQCAVEFEKAIPSVSDALPMSLEVVLTSANGETIQRMVQPVRNSGVLTDSSSVEAVSEDSASRGLSMTGDFPDHDLGIAPKAGKKGLLSRLFGGLGGES